MHARTLPAALVAVAHVVALVTAALAAGGCANRSRAHEPGTTSPGIAPGASGDAVLDALAPAPLEPATELASAIARRLDEHLADTATRRAYLRVDRPLYRPGQPIRFRVDLRETATFAPAPATTAEVALHAPDGTTVGSARVEIADGVAGGKLALAEDAPGGTYTLEAWMGSTFAKREVAVASFEPPRLMLSLSFTRKAHGPGDPVRAMLEARRASGEPLANRKMAAVCVLDGDEIARAEVTTDAAGGAAIAFDLPAEIRAGDALLTVIASDGGVAESIQRRVPIVLDELDLAMFPEGGALVAGLPGRVYFAAKDTRGRPADVEGRVLDDRGREVTAFRSLRDGMGRFELTPVPGRHYRAVLTRPAGIASAFDLPDAVSEGCTLRTADATADDSSQHLRLGVFCTRARKLLLEAVQRERRVGSGVVTVPAGHGRAIALPLTSGGGGGGDGARVRQGVVRVTVLDESGVPLAERLVYRGRGRDLRVSITPDRDSYGPRERVKLAVRTTDAAGRPVSASIGLAVVDDAVLSLADDARSHVLAQLYLAAELDDPDLARDDGVWANPGYYFSDDPDAARALDLVMGTAGWRAFAWRRVLPVPPETRPLGVREPAAGVGQIAGYVRDLDSGELVPGATVVATSPGETRHFAEITDENGRYVIELPPGRYEVTLYYADSVTVRRNVDVRGGATTPVHLRVDTASRGEVIAIEGRAPVIDMDYAKTIPVPGRTFEAVLGAAAGAQGDAQGVSFAGASSLENSYVVTRVRNPDSRRGAARPRTDFRETVFWDADVRTGADGTATVELALADSVTSFRVIAEGFSHEGLPGRGEAVFRSSLPLALDARIPLEVSAGDVIELPVTVTNQTGQAIEGGELSARFGPAFRLADGAQRRAVSLAADDERVFTFRLEVVGAGGAGETATAGADGEIHIEVRAAGMTDAIRRRIPVAPLGYPVERSLSGALAGALSGTRTRAHTRPVAQTVERSIDLADALPGTIEASVALYPSPLASMTQGLESILREPHGCFEQTSSSSYPNLLVLKYVQESARRSEGAAEPGVAAIAARASELLDRGYQRLIGFETPERGYEWFGQAPGHEALTAYGLMQFAEMQRVRGGVDRAMMERTTAWLLARRDGNGGFARDERSIDAFGSASAATASAYITWALASIGRGADIRRELDAQAEAAARSADPYLVALATGAWAAAEPGGDVAARLAGRLAAMQHTGGSFPGAAETITMSGGASRAVETTALAALALIAASPRGEHAGVVRRAVEWLIEQRAGDGGFGSTQATILALDALTAYARTSSRARSAGVAAVAINGRAPERTAFAANRADAIVFAGLGRALRPGRNAIRLDVELEAAPERRSARNADRKAGAAADPMPYSVAVSYRSMRPPTSPRARVAVHTALAQGEVRAGEGVRLTARVVNTTDAGVPMTLARIGIPGGLTAQTWQLDELRKAGVVDFYETGPREVVVYFRSLAPRAERVIDIDLLARVPGRYTAPPSMAYLYYTAEDKSFAPPVAVTIR